jgi:methyltransferase (TIGR00027 family)
MSRAAPKAGPSRTALGVAALRAAHRLIDGAPKILDDPIAERLVDARDLARIAADPAALHEPASRRLRAHVLLRSRYAEDRLREAARRGVRQCVILGAGFDTFAYRQPAWSRRLRIFEVDHPATQADKGARLAAAGIAVPANVEFVGVDFETVSLGDGLRAASLDFARPAFFTCLGVLVYLTQTAVDQIFQLVAGFPPGSEIVFTFSRPDSSGSAIAQRAAAAGEPWRSHFDPEGLGAKLLAAGFASLSFLGPAQAAHIFEGRTDGLEAPARCSIAAAVVG